MSLKDCVKGKHKLKEFKAGRVNTITGDLEIYYECVYCRYNCYIKQEKQDAKASSR